MKHFICHFRRFTYNLIGIILLPAGAMAQNVSNYTFSALAGSYTQIQGLPGAISPALSGGGNDDGWYNSKPIGFTFIYDGIGYTTFSANTNGWITLGGPISVTGSTNNLATGTPRPIIAPLWDDIALNAAGSFTYYLSGTFPNRIMTIEWLNERWSYLASSAVIDFQVKLYENNRRIEFVYRQQAGTGNTENASIGLAGIGTNVFLSLNSTSTTPTVSSITETNNIFGSPLTGQIYRFDHYPLIPTVTSVSPLYGNTLDIITIYGTNFDLTPSNNICYFGAVKATVVTASSTMLTVFLPVDATYARPTVTTLSSHFTALAPLPFDITFPCGGYISNASFVGNYNYITPYSFTRNLTFEDIDGDGKTDMAVSTDGGCTVARNISTPGILNSSSFSAFTTFASSDPTSDIAFSDIDGDGKKEMISANYSTIGQDSISIYKNTSTPGTINASTFSPKVNFKCGGYPRVDMGDIDRDGKTDLIVAERVNNQITIRKNYSSLGVINTGTFGASVAFPVGNSPYDLCVGDMDGDSKLDIITINSTDLTISVLRNTSTSGIINTSSFAPKVDFPLAFSGYKIRLADIDGDGKLDVVAAANGNTAGATILSIYRNTSISGTISFASRTDISSTTTFNDSFDVGDLDGDGKVDIAMSVGPASNFLKVLKNQSTPGVISLLPSYSLSISTTNAFDMEIADLDSDSKPEIAFSDGANGNVEAYHNIVAPFNAIAPATVLNSTQYCDDGTWKTFYDPAIQGNVLVAIKDNGNNLGTTTVTEYKDPLPGNYLGIRFLARHFKIVPSTQPTTSVQVRLYFTPAEYTALQAVNPSLLSVANLSVTKYDGPTEDGNYNPLDATSLVWIPQVSITNATGYGGYYLEFTISSFSEFWIHTGSGPLPIELLDFSATPKEDHVELNWSTATETNNDFFTIEKTQDGITFETVGRIDGAGTSSTIHTYSSIDSNPFSGTSFYRLKQTDFNGQFSYSEFREVQFVKEDDQFSVFPNPGNGVVNFICPGEKDDLVSLQIFDNTGRIVSEKEVTISELEHQSLYLDQGIYSVVVTRGSKIFIRQVVIL